jgi:hypothetical protein
LPDSSHEVPGFSRPDPAGWVEASTLPEYPPEDPVDRALEAIYRRWPNGEFDPSTKRAIAEFVAAYVVEQTAQVNAKENAEYESGVEIFRSRFLCSLATMMSAKFVNHHLTWLAFSVSMGLQDTAGLTLKQVAKLCDSSVANLSKQVTMINRMCGFEGGFVCKSRSTARAYATCQRKPKTAARFEIR